MQTLLFQSGQSINWLAGLPSLISGLCVIAVQLFLAYRFSKLTENHKAALSKELEDYKKDNSAELQALQSEFQLSNYQFQTKYSVLHQKRAEAIEKLFGLLATVQNNLPILIGWEAYKRSDNKEEFYSKTLDDFRSLIEFYKQKRIYFDQDVVDQVRTLEGTMSTLLLAHDSGEWLSSTASGFGKEKAVALSTIQQNIRPLMDRLEATFKVLLSAEAPSYQTGKNL